MTHVVLLVSSGILHPPWLGRFWLRSALNTIPGYNFHQIPSLEKILNLPIDHYHSMVLYFHQKAISNLALETLDHYVRQGGGLLAIHSATASFKNAPRYFDILGGRFRDHGPVQFFQVEPVAPNDEVFGDITPFTVRDELYRHEYDPDNHIHFYATVDDQQEPIIWTRTYGRGRVCYCALGHRSDIMRQPEVVEILQRGLIWVCTGAANNEGTP